MTSKEHKPHERRLNPNSHIYNGWKWKKTTSAFRKANPLCVECLKKGISTDATGKNGVTDHITPINEGGAIYDWDNLQTLCNKCHNIKSAKEAHK